MNTQNLRTMKVEPKEKYLLLKDLSGALWKLIDARVDDNHPDLSPKQSKERANRIATLQSLAEEYDRQASEIYNDPGNWDHPGSIEKRAVIIPARDEHNGHDAIIVTLFWVCPKCGGARGETFDGRSYDGSRILEVSCWINPCGHVDEYKDVRDEAKHNGLNY